MDIETARFWLRVVAAGACALWFAGFVFVRLTRRRLTATTRTGSVELDGDAAALQRRAAAALARDGGRSSALQRVRVDGAGAGGEVRWSSSFPFAPHVGLLQFDAAGVGRSRASWAVRMAPQLLRGTRLFTILNAVLVAALYLLLDRLVAPSENPAVRGQVLQMAQAIHVLWPPFLFAGLTRKVARDVDAEIERLVHNLPHAGD
ncbi:MAG: hypothetical protein AB7O97_19810 [Planctomycetota bacterium]